MTSWLFGAWLGLQVICRRLELDPDQILAIWHSRPVIEIYDPSPGTRRAHLSLRMDTVYPF